MPARPFQPFPRNLAKANPELAGSVWPSATTIDAALHTETLAIGAQAQRFCTSIEELPNGVFITDDDQTANLVLKGQLLCWTSPGYEPPSGQPIHYPARVLTPASVVRTFEAGYPVGIHPSAFCGFTGDERGHLRLHASAGVNVI
jgi:hypothetical protein